MKTILGLLAAAGVLVVGGALVATLVGAFDPVEAQEDPTEEQAPAGDEATDSDDGFVRGFVGDFVEDVLAGLVADDTITEEQAAKIAATFATRAEEMLADLPDLEMLLSESSPLPEFLEDGELSEEERAQLEDLLGGFAPFGPRAFHFFGEDGEIPEELKDWFERFEFGEVPFGDFLEDGELSEDERAQLQEMFGDRFGEGHEFRFFTEDGEVPEDFEGFPFGGRGFHFFSEDGEIPGQLRDWFESFEFGEVPFGDFLEDGELSEEERAQLQEYFGQFRGRGFGGLFEGLDPTNNVDEAAFSA